MGYRFIIYRTSGWTKAAPIVQFTNRAFNDDIDADPWDLEEENLLDFDAEAIKTEIHTALGEQCKAPIRSVNGRPYLEVHTDWNHAPIVLREMLRITEQNDLVLFDTETKRCYYREMLEIRTVSEMKLRARQLINAINGETERLRAIQKLQEWYNPYSCARGLNYVVTIRRIKDVPFEDRILAFDACLRKHLEEGEELLHGDDCFIVYKEFWAIRFCFEGYNKHANRIGIMEDGEARAKILHRMGGWEMLHYLHTDPYLPVKEVMDRLDIYEMERNYPNPCDRLAASIRISKRLQKSPFGIRFETDRGYFKKYGFFDFEMMDTFWEERREYRSVLSMDEETASFLLPLIREVCPAFYDNYYGDNILTYDVLNRLIEIIGETKLLMLADPASPALEAYLRTFDFWSLCPNEEEKTQDRVAMLTKNRTDILELYHIFTDWLHEQMVRYDGATNVLRIRGG